MSPNRWAGTSQAATRHQQTAALRAAEADAATTPDDRDRLRREAAEAAALAEVLNGRVTQLEQASLTRARWYAHTAPTRAAAERAAAELSSRHANHAQVDDEPITAEQWLSAHHDAERAEEVRRTAAAAG